MRTLPVLILAPIIAFHTLAPCSGGHAADAPSGADASRNSVAIEVLSRLKGIDLEANPTIKAKVISVIESTKGTPQFVELVRDFKLQGQEAALLDFAIAHPSDSAAADALRQVLANNQVALLEKTLHGTNAARIVEPLGNTGDKQIVPLLEPLLTDKQRDVTVRQRTVHALAQVQEGAASLLRLAKDGKLPDDLKLIASSELNAVRWANLKAEAARVLPLPQSQNSEPLLPVLELVKRTGDPKHGEELFFSPLVACGTCHEVNGKGVDFGPKLSEIGTKLGKDALYVSILDPNAGISFGYETWQLALKNGDEAYGLLTSETADEVAIKAPGGLITRYKKADIAKRDKLPTSTMPTGLQQIMSVQDLVDLVEYLATLKKTSN